MSKVRIDCLQYANWDLQIFEQMREAKLNAVHVTIAYHETFRETVLNLERWNIFFEKYSNLIFQGFTGDDVLMAQEKDKTAIFFGFQNPSPIEDDIGLIDIWHRLGIRFMQLTYNNQSLLATGCYENSDSGLTRMGREVISEMNRVGMVIDMSHSGEVSTLEAIETSKRPICISHANPYSWFPARRNKSNKVLKALSQANGMIGFSLYPHHLKNKSHCTLEDFCEMIYDTADKIGIDSVGIGSDLCQGQPDSVVEWMRVGRWTKNIDYGEGSQKEAGFPDMPDFYKDNRDFPSLASGLKSIGFSEEEIDKVLGDNWLSFFEKNFKPG
jgi:microsomal dipeptidase-like Zn-dependent dipeptidase